MVSALASDQITSMDLLEMSQALLGLSSLTRHKMQGTIEGGFNGRVAQLGERTVRIREVRGSNPLTSTRIIAASGDRKPL